MVVEYMCNCCYVKCMIEFYSKWIISFICFNDNRYLLEMGDKDVELFLFYLVNKKNVVFVI